jgi:hypothetical protein
MGYIGIANDMINIVRCMLVNTTYSRDMYYQSPPSKDAPLTEEVDEKDIHIYEKGPGMFFIHWQRERFTCHPREGDLDYPKRRITFRKLTGLAGLLFLAATIPGIIANQHFGNLLANTGPANSIYRLRWVQEVFLFGARLMKCDRYASSAVTLLFILLTAYSTIWAYAKLPRIRTKAVLMLVTVCTLMVSVGR